MADYEKIKIKIDDEEKNALRNDSYYITIGDAFDHVLASD
uniref:Uncharacterized protein n=1 Tax=viral metagenome TaxID=1070528 RepID=A0A6C0B6T9_9ZZZZ